MKLSYLTASTAALLLSSTALVAQEASGGAMGAMDFTQSVFIDVDGAAYQVPIDLAAELCATDAATLTQTAQSAFDASGMDPAMMQGAGTDTAAAGTGTDASGAAAGTEAGTDTASADAGATAGTDAGAADTAATDTATADAGATGDAAATTGTDTATADAGGTTGTEAGNTGAAGVASDTQTADANAAAGTEGAAGDVQNVETTAADSSTAGTSQSFTAAGEEYLALVVCQVDAATASATGSTFAPASDAGATN